jgi:hypothetical protein
MWVEVTTITIRAIRSAASVLHLTGGVSGRTA